MIFTILQALKYNGMKETGDQILTRTVDLEQIENDNTKRLRKELKYPTTEMPPNVDPIKFESNQEKIKILREATFPGPFRIASDMVKTEILDPELVEIGWKRFNFPWYTEYSTSRYRKCLCMMFYKYPDNK